MNHKERIKQILYDYETAGLIEGDFEKVLSLMTDDVIGVGMGEQGFISSKKEVKEIILKTAKKEQAVTYELDYEFITINIKQEISANLCAKVIVKRKKNNIITYSEFMQSLSFIFQNESWYICALHASPVKLTKESIEAYPLSFADINLKQLRTEVQEQALELMNESISGGIIGFYKKHDKYPLYVINDSMLKYLGYSREEFYYKFREDASLIIEKDDLEQTKEAIEEAERSKKDIELYIKVQKKDKTYLSMIQKIRFITDNLGNEVILGVFIDVTEMKNLQNKLEKQTTVLEEYMEELSLQNEELMNQKDKFEEQARELAINEERFRIALEKTSNIIFDCNLKTGTIIHLNLPLKNTDFIANIENIKETLILGGTILEPYFENFSQAFKKVEKGKSQSECVIKAKLSAGKEVWNKISMTGIKDCRGKTVRIIGMIEDITDQKEAELAYAREEQYRQAVLSHVLASYLINFTKGIFEDCNINSEDAIIVKRGDFYNKFIEKVAKTKVNEKDRKTFLNTFSQDNILYAFQNGTEEISLEYEFFGQDGTNIWKKATMRLLLDVYTKERKGFFYVADISQKKFAEIELIRKSELDPLTAVYNKGTVEAKIKGMLKVPEVIQTGVFLILDVDYFKKINDTYGHPFGDVILENTACILKNNFHETDIIGRLGGDEFCVFFWGIHSKKQIERLIDRIVNHIYEIFSPEKGKPGVSCSVGVSCCAGKNKTFEQLYKEADIALYKVKESGRNNFEIYREIDI